MAIKQSESRLLLYEKVRILKKGSLKTVCLVRHVKTDEIMLMKELQGINKTYEKLLSIKQKNLQEVYDVFYVLEKTYLICEYVTGDTLESILQNNVLPYKLAKNYTLQLCNAITTLHTNKPPIIHRDIKLSNIIISNNDELKLIDYDTIREYKNKNETDTILLGTQGYAAPEQYGFAQTDEKTDIFAIGMVMYKMLAGIDADTSKNYNGRYKTIVKKCLQLDPKNRFKSVYEIKKAFNNKIRYSILICTISLSALILVFVVDLKATIKNLIPQSNNIQIDNMPQNDIETMQIDDIPQIDIENIQGIWTVKEMINTDTASLSVLYFMDNKILYGYFENNVMLNVEFGYYTIDGNLLNWECYPLNTITYEYSRTPEKKEGFINISENMETLYFSYNFENQYLRKAYFRDYNYDTTDIVNIIHILDNDIKN